MSYNHIKPTHYKVCGHEVIDMMEKIWGREAVVLFCQMNEFKYRMRLGSKPDQPIERDLEKARQYAELAKKYDLSIPDAEAGNAQVQNRDQQET